MKLRIAYLENRVKKQTNTNLKLHKRNVYWKTKFEKLEQTILELKEKRIDEEFSLSMSKFNVIQKEFFKRAAAPSKRQCTPAFKSFVLTVHFKSPDAYKYIRTCFNNNMPHPRTLSSWYSNLNFTCGFHKEAFDAIEEYANSIGRKLICNVVVDEVSIRVNPSVIGGVASGYVDLGSGPDMDEVANKALVFMVVGLSEKLKLPIGYFFTKALVSQQLAHLIDMSFQLLKERGVVISGISFDCAQVNIAAIKILGANLRPPFLANTFVHQGQLHIAHPDPPHCMKNIRNHHAEHVIQDADGGQIKFQYFRNLHDLQESLGFHLGNKIRKGHIHFEGHKMKAKYALQLYSDSVASALDFLREIHQPGFHGSEATAKFCRMLNKAFDMLNSRNFSYGFKAAVTRENYSDISQVRIFCCLDYLFTI